MSSPAVTCVVSVIVMGVMPVIITVMPMIIGGMIGRWWRCRDETRKRTHCSADRGTESRTVAAGNGGPDRRPAAGADQTAPNHPLHGVVWIGASREG